MVGVGVFGVERRGPRGKGQGAGGTNSCVSNRLSIVVVVSGADLLSHAWKYVLTINV